MVYIMHYSRKYSRKSKSKIKAEMEKINKLCPVGTPVRFGKISTITTTPAISMNGNIVLWCKDVSGCIDFEHLTIINPSKNK